MTVTGTADTAELPKVMGVGMEASPAVLTLARSPLAAGPAVAALIQRDPAGRVVDQQVTAEVTSGTVTELPLDRLALRAERQQARRVRRRWALLGLSVMAASLGATVAVLDAVH